MAVDEEVRSAIDSHLLPRPNTASRRQFGGVCYMVQGKMFATLMEGVVAMKLPDQLRQTALTLAGVSPFRAPGGGPFGQWIQFVILLDDDVPSVLPWLEASSDYVDSLPARSKRRRKASP